MKAANGTSSRFFCPLQRDARRPATSATGHACWLGTRRSPGRDLITRETPSTSAANDAPRQRGPAPLRAHLHVCLLHERAIERSVKWGYPDLRGDEDKPSALCAARVRLARYIAQIPIATENCNIISLRQLKFPGVAKTRDMRARRLQRRRWWRYAGRQFP